MKKGKSETIEAITNFLFIGKPQSALTIYDLVIVLGNDDIKGTIDELYELYTAGFFSPECHVILSGNVGLLNQGKPPEAERLYNEAVLRGMPPNMFWLEKRATNALQNFRFSKEIIESHGGFDNILSILCIGKAFLLRRAKMCASACGYPENKLSYYGTVEQMGRNIGPDTWWQSESARIRVMEEIERIAKYTLKGDLSID